MLFKSIFTNTAGTLFSRILGFMRDMMMASVLGASLWSDIFFIAFKIPNLFRTIFAEGAFTQAFIPNFARARHRGEFASSIFFRFTAFLFGMSLVVTLFSAPFTALIAFGYSSEVIALAAPLVALNFWYLDLIFAVTFLAGLLQYKRHFAVSAFGTGLLNIAMIVALWVATGLEAKDAVVILSWGVLGGGVLQLVAHIWVAKNYGIMRHLVLGTKRLFKGEGRSQEDSSRFSRSFFPSVLGSSTSQISAFIDTILGTFLATGSISYLYYANRIFQLPLALFAIATATALFPMVACAIRNTQHEEALSLMKKSLWLLLFLLSFSALGGMVLSREIMYLLFERGAFTHEDTLASGVVLQMYLVGLVPFGIAKIFNLWMYSHNQQAKAAKISAVALSFNILFSLALFYPLGVAGLALSGSLTGCVLLYLTLQAFGFRKAYELLADKKRWSLLVLGLGVFYGVLVGVKSYFFDFII